MVNTVIISSRLLLLESLVTITHTRVLSVTR